METALTVAHTHMQGQVADTACRTWEAGPSTTATSRDEACANLPGTPRRAWTFLLTDSATISSMTTSDLDAAPIVPVLVRLQVPNRDGLRERAAVRRESMCRHLEALIRGDLTAPGTAPFVTADSPTFVSRGKNGAGRPTKGVRPTVMLRIEPALREAIHRRASALQLTVNDYLESLVSQDISAARASKEAVALSQTA